MTNFLLNDVGSDPEKRIKDFLLSIAAGWSDSDIDFRSFLRLMHQNSTDILSFEEHQRNILSVLIMINLPEGRIPLRVVLKSIDDTHIMCRFELVSIDREELTHPIMDI